MSRFNTRAVLGAAAAACVLAVASCGGGQQETDAGAQQPPTTQAQAPSGTGSATEGASKAVTITVRSGDAGDYLVDGTGTTVYLYTKDQQGVSNCSGKCIEAWPAVLGQPKAGDGVDAGKLGTIQRDNGKSQVTYAGHPLYYFVKDTEPGQTSGQAVKNVWYLVSPDGTAIKQSSDSGGVGY